LTNYSNEIAKLENFKMEKTPLIIIAAVKTKLSFNKILILQSNDSGINPRRRTRTRLMTEKENQSSSTSDDNTLRETLR